MFIVIYLFTTKSFAQILAEKFSVERLAYYGGKYDSPGLRMLIKKTKGIFPEIKNYLLSLPDQCKNEEVVTMCNEYAETFLILGNLFSDLRVPPPVDHRTYIGNAKRNITALKHKYLSLNLSITPKAYATFWHLIPQIEMHGCLEPYVEDFIEQAHQFGMLEENQIRNVANKEKEAKMHCRYECEHTNVNVLKRAKEVKDESSRKFKKTRINKAEETKRNLKIIKDEIAENEANKDINNLTIFQKPAEAQITETRQTINPDETDKIRKEIMDLVLPKKEEKDSDNNSDNDSDNDSDNLGKPTHYFT